MALQTSQEAPTKAHNFAPLSQSKGANKGTEDGRNMTPANQIDLAGIRILDGGMATELEKLGCDLSGPLWSASVLREQPEKIAAVHAAYLSAGADCILTASYQVSAEAYAEIGLSPEDAAASLRESVRIAEDVRTGFYRTSPPKVLIAVSLGPYGAALHNGAEYDGNYDISFDQLVNFHARRLAVLAQTNADLIAFETVPSREEARAIVAALEQHPEISAWVSFTCSDPTHTAHGEAISDCGGFLDSVPQVLAVGINCTAPAFVTPLIRALKATTTKPIVVYPNSGEGWDADTRSWKGKADPASFAESARGWRLAGVQIIGGCCRTGPDHVRAVRKMMMETEAQTVDAPAEAARGARRRSKDRNYLWSELAEMVTGAAAPSLLWALAGGLVLGYLAARRPKNAPDRSLG
jgi:homocysteine S-methyltransferase